MSGNNGNGNRQSPVIPDDDFERFVIPAFGSRPSLLFPNDTELHVDDPADSIPEMLPADGSCVHLEDGARDPCLDDLFDPVHEVKYDDIISAALRASIEDEIGNE